MPQPSHSDPKSEAPALTELQNAASAGAPVASRRPVPVGTVAFATALYAVLYLVWEQSGWGSAGMRDLIGNMAFMPRELTVLTLFARASRRESLDPDVRGALRLLALGGAMVFIGNALSTGYVITLQDSPPVSWADLLYLSDS